jgi:hypothetical protein
MNVLITAATSAEAHKLKKQLIADNIILGDYQEMPAFMQILKLPNPASLSYAHEILTLCLDKEIGMVYALGKEELNNLLEAEQLFTEFGIELVHRP